MLLPEFGVTENGEGLGNVFEFLLVLGLLLLAGVSVLVRVVAYLITDILLLLLL